MKISIKTSSLLKFVIDQINSFFPDGKAVQAHDLKKSFDHSMQRLEFCFSKVNNKYYRDESRVFFNHLNGDQYAIFLYYLSNTCFKNNVKDDICNKIFLLNRSLNGIDMFYEVDLPDIFLLVHPIGTILGRGEYSDYLVVYQKCGIGSNHEIYPTLRKNVTLRPGASIIGNCKVGENCEIGAESLLMDKNLEDNTLYVGNPKKYSIYKREKHNPVWF
jgi:serine O-acetyltransferase